MLWLARAGTPRLGVSPGAVAFMQLWALHLHENTGPPTAAVGANWIPNHTAAVHAECSSGPGAVGKGRWGHDDSGHFPGAVKGDCSFVFQVRGAQEVLGDPWVAWEAVEETEAAFPHEGPGVPEETHPEEETSNTELETGSAPIRTCCSGPTDSLLVTSPHTLPCSHSEEKWCVLCPENLYDD